jgi:hypothetical protein
MVGQGSPGLPVLRGTRDATALSVMQGNTMAAKARKVSSQNYCAGIEGRLVMADHGRLNQSTLTFALERVGSRRRRQP